MKENDFLQGKIAPELIRFAIPLMFSLILQALYGAVDLVVVGQFGTTASVSAVATGSQVMHALTVIVTGFAMGVTVLIGQAIGANDKNRIGTIIASQIKLFSVVTILITILAVIFTEQIVTFMSVPEDAVSETISYIRICSSGMIFISAYNGISSIFRGMGNSKLPLLFVSVACVFNIGLDILFVYGFNLASSGAALATISAQCVSVIFSVIYIKKTKMPFKLTKKSFKGSETVKMILKLGAPISLQEFLVSMSFLIITSIVNSLGLIASASVGVAEKMFIFLALIPMSFMSALSAFVAQNIGAEQFGRAKEALKLTIKISLCFGITMTLLTFFKGDLLASIFTTDPDVIETTKVYLQGVSLEHIFIAVSFCMLGYFNGRGKTTFVMIQGLATSFAVRIPLSFYFSRIENTNMFLIGLAIPISALAGVLMCIFYYIHLQRKDKLGISNQIV